ncbi:hypothetical protein [Nocardioides mesophilus]|uniref:Uncharacterized protein n=1 Tax=Nocardioides mesophilus TaxID=433659 RepID=A0A7G9RBR3_9ACTN|nr:hypothetical protein [Nocardioides mesophilus]QNN53038.1 hypothetical protein H9L09_00575 [Nocardioides mesophilus]
MLSGVAAVWAAVAVDTTVVAPTGVDVLVALGVGLLVGRELLGRGPIDETDRR